MKKTIAILFGILTFIICSIGSFILPFYVGDLANKLSNTKTENFIGQDWSFDRPEISNFYFFYLFAISLAIGLTVTFIMCDFTDSYRKRLFIYIPFMIIILGFTGYNYAHADFIIKRDIQIILNLILLFLSSVCLSALWNLKAKSKDGIILKYFIFSLLLLFSFVNPAIL
jgi:hypothetical protein